MTHLYRHFGQDGTLLYVGVSLNALQRLGQHRFHAHWFDQIVRVEMQSFPTRQAALEAEQAAIVSERPLFNIQYSEQQAEARAAARVQRNEVIKATPNPTTENLKRDRQQTEAAFFQWRAPKTEDE